jgi:peptidoglycan/LPS O-acetylase OafA/YrhL
MKYRADIDGLRAISVLAVIAFHSGINFFSGGYIGVDIFFVISGYLVTSFVVNEIDNGTFTFKKFYKRRVARLFPSLLILFIVVILFGFIFYDNKKFDNLGKEVFFSSIGAANILFGKGTNYFSQDISSNPLLHMWSLGIEEQFYLIWPTILIFIYIFKRRYAAFITFLMLISSFLLANSSVTHSPVMTYFYPQYRAFELLIGAETFFLEDKFSRFSISSFLSGIIFIFSILFIFLSMFLLNKGSEFPGFNTLYP